MLIRNSQSNEIFGIQYPDENRLKKMFKSTNFSYFKQKKENKRKTHTHDHCLKTLLVATKRPNSYSTIKFGKSLCLLFLLLSGSVKARLVCKPQNINSYIDI